MEVFPISYSIFKAFWVVFSIQEFPAEVEIPKSSISSEKAAMIIANMSSCPGSQSNQTIFFYMIRSKIISNLDNIIIVQNKNLLMEQEMPLKASKFQKNENLKNLITQILFSNTAYDCMPSNSLICSVDKQISLYDAINILVSENLEELLVWDSQQNKWIWMLTIVDVIRLLLHAIKSMRKKGKISFEDFQQGNFDLSHVFLESFQVQTMIAEISSKRLIDIMGEIGEKNYRIKNLMKQHKLSFIVLTMSVEKIHRILIQDIESEMYVSIISLKDILLYLLRIANQLPNNYYNIVPIKQLFESAKPKNYEIEDDKPLWLAFYYLTDLYRTLWINIVDKDNKSFKGILFRQDFRELIKSWRLSDLYMSVGEYIQQKKKQEGKIPEFRFFSPDQVTKEIIWKIVMTKRNAIVCLEKDTNRVLSTIGLAELFSLYVQ